MSGKQHSHSDIPGFCKDTTWTCRTCDQTVYGPPLNIHCTTLDGPATVRISTARDYGEHGPAGGRGDQAAGGGPEPPTPELTVPPKTRSKFGQSASVAGRKNRPDSPGPAPRA